MARLPKTKTQQEAEEVTPVTETPVDETNETVVTEPVETVTETDAPEEVVPVPASDPETKTDSEVFERALKGDVQFDETVVDYEGQPITEKQAVHEYDKFRANLQVYNEYFLAILPKMAFLAHRFADGAASSGWDQHDRQARYYALTARANGEQLV